MKIQGRMNSLSIIIVYIVNIWCVLNDFTSFFCYSDLLNELAVTVGVPELPPWKDEMFYKDMKDLMKQPRLPMSPPEKK